jgi:hypothetical protein
MRGRYATRLHKWIEALDGNAATSKANRCFYKDSLEKEEMGFHSFAKTCVLFDDAEFSMLRLWVVRDLEGTQTIMRYTSRSGRTAEDSSLQCIRRAYEEDPKMTAGW